MSSNSSTALMSNPLSGSSSGGKRSRKNSSKSARKSSARNSSARNSNARNMSLAASRSMAASMARSMALAGGRKRRGKRGGAGGAEYVLDNYGSGDVQWRNVFEKGGPFGNEIQNLHHPNAVQSMAHKGGRSKRRGKKGGYWSTVINQALVPFGLMGLQYSYGKTRKNR